MNITVRPCSESDYSELAKIHNAIYPDTVKVVAQFYDKNAEQNPNCKFARWVALLDSTIVGYTDYRQWAILYVPDEFYIEVFVHPNYQTQGIGTQLYQTLLDSLSDFQARKLTTVVRNDQVSGIEFVTNQGFNEYWRQIHWTLDVTQADLSLYDSLESGLEAEGIVIKTLTELSDDPDRNQKLYDLYWQLIADEPVDEDIQPTEFEMWISQHLGKKSILPDSYFIAVYGDHYIGMTSNWRTTKPNILSIGITGVRQSFKRRGIGTALKVRGIKATQQIGAVHLKTDNESNNQPILKLNEKLGFTREFEWMRYEKEMTSNA